MRVPLYVLIAVVILAATAIYREILAVEQSQMQILTNQQRIMDNLEKFNDNFFNLETRIIRIQLAFPDYVKDGP